MRKWSCVEFRGGKGECAVPRVLSKSPPLSALGTAVFREMVEAKPTL